MSATAGHCATSNADREAILTARAHDADVATTSSRPFLRADSPRGALLAAAETMRFRPLGFLGLAAWLGASCSSPTPVSPVSGEGAAGAGAMAGGDAFGGAAGVAGIDSAQAGGPAGGSSGGPTETPTPDFSFVAVTQAEFGLVAVGSRRTATGYLGVLAFSIDATSWQVVRDDLPYIPTAVAAGLGRAIAIANADGASAVAYSSSDGIQWEQAPTEATDARGVAFGNGVFLLGESQPPYRVFRSTDGLTWRSSTGPGVHALGAAFGRNTFVLYDANHTATSTDGMIWATNRLAPAPNGSFHTVGAMRFSADAFYVDGDYFDCCYGEIPPRRITLRSPDGAHWESTPSGRVLEETPASCVVLDGGFVAVGSSCDAARAASDRSFDAEDGLVRASLRVHFVVVGHGIMTSDDGRSWRLVFGPQGPRS